MTGRHNGCFSSIGFRLPLLAVAVLVLVFACDSTVVSEPNEEEPEPQNDTDRPLGPDRFEQLEPLDLEEGEAKEGIHLRPGIEVIRLGHASEDEGVVVDSEQKTVELTGDAREVLEEFDGVWSDDILLGEDFIFLISDIRQEGDKLVVEVEQFELLRVIHGEWDIELEPEDVGSELMLQMTDDRMLIRGSIDVDGDEEQGESSFGFSIGDFIKSKLKFEGEDVTYEGEASAALDIDGSVSFPVDWNGEFRGKITKAGIRVNEHYECDTYTERVTKRRYILWGEEYDVLEERQPDDFCIDYVLVKGSLGLEAEVTAAVETSSKLKAEITEEVELMQMRALLGQTGLALYFVPYIKGGLEAYVEAALDLAVEAGTSVSVPLGFEYDPHDTGFSLLPNERHGVTSDPYVSDPVVEGGVEMNIDVFTQLGLKMHLSDAASSKGFRATGPKGGVQFGYDFDYRPVQVSLGGAVPEPCAEAALYIKAFGDANLRGELVITENWTWGIDLTDWSPGELRYNLLHWESDGTDWCVLVGPDTLDISLLWQADTHLELFVETPTGNTLSPEHALEADGGTHHPVEPQAECKSDTEETCYARTVWEMEDPRPPTGTYWVWATNFTGEDTANFEILVSGDDGDSNQVIKHVTDALPASEGAPSEQYMFTIGE